MLPTSTKFLVITRKNEMHLIIRPILKNQYQYLTSTTMTPIKSTEKHKINIKLFVIVFINTYIWA